MNTCTASGIAARTCRAPCTSISSTTGIPAAKRARQINSYYHNLGEGTFDEFPPPMVDTASKNYLTIALEEVAAGKLSYHYR